MKSTILRAMSIFFFLLFWGNKVIGQSGVNPAKEPDTHEKDIIPPITILEFQLSLIILGFGLIVLILETIVIKTNNIKSDEAFKFIIITLIILSTLFLVSAGYNNNQIASAIGLLGTIAGYLLGRATNKSETNK